MLTALVTGALLFVGCQQNSDPERLFTDQSTGSKVTKFAAVLRDRRVWGGHVVRWVPVVKAERNAVVNNRYGSFRAENIGDVNTKTLRLPEDFTGEVTCFVNRLFKDSVAIIFVFINGVLKERSWGYMPG